MHKLFADRADAVAGEALANGSKDFGPGKVVRHRDRGPGQVTSVHEDGRTVVTFDNGEVHRWDELP